MKIHYRYRCDYGHEWVISRDENEPILPSDLSCQEGHERVTLQKEYPVEDVQILISPAARVIDDLKQQKIMEGLFDLSLLDRNGVEKFRTRKPYSWNQIIGFASFFQGKNMEDASIWWERRKL